MFNGFVIDFEYLFATRQGSDEHYKSAFGQVEIGYQRVDALEFVGGIYEYLRVATLRADYSVVARGALQRAHRSSADGDYPAPLRLCLVYSGGGLFGYAEILAVHFMVGDYVLLDGAECTQPDVKEHFNNLNAHILDFLQQFGGKVQPRGRRGGGAVGFGVDRLVAVFVLQFFVNLRGERH